MGMCGGATSTHSTLTLLPRHQSTLYGFPTELISLPGYLLPIWPIVATPADHTSKGIGSRCRLESCYATEKKADMDPTCRDEAG